MKNIQTGMACNLTVFSTEERVRFPALTQTLIADAQKIRELENGFALQFYDQPEQRAQIEAFIKRESQCCSFLNFDLTHDTASETLWLHITGENGVKEFLKMELANINNQEVA